MIKGTNDPNAKPAAWDYANAGDDDYPLFEGKATNHDNLHKARLNPTGGLVPSAAVYPRTISKTETTNTRKRA